MNRTNNWKELLGYANEELKPKGYSIRITRDGSGCYGKYVREPTALAVG